MVKPPTPHQPPHDTVRASRTRPHRVLPRPFDIGLAVLGAAAVDLGTWAMALMMIAIGRHFGPSPHDWLGTGIDLVADGIGARAARGDLRLQLASPVAAGLVCATLALAAAFAIARTLRRPSNRPLAGSLASTMIGAGLALLAERQLITTLARAWVRWAIP